MRAPLGRAITLILFLTFSEKHEHAVRPKFVPAVPGGPSREAPATGLHHQDPALDLPTVFQGSQRAYSRAFWLKHSYEVGMSRSFCFSPRSLVHAGARLVTSLTGRNLEMAFQMSTSLVVFQYRLLPLRHGTLNGWVMMARGKVARWFYRSLITHWFTRSLTHSFT